jgi:hypothetical protein
MEEGYTVVASRIYHQGMRRRRWWFWTRHLNLVICRKKSGLSRSLWDLANQGMPIFEDSKWEGCNASECK